MRFEESAALVGAGVLGLSFWAALACMVVA